MHIYFSGIGGAGHSGLAILAHQAGYEVSGSDQTEGSYTQYLRQHGITDIHIGQSAEEMAKVQSQKPIDWFVYTSALPKDHAELEFAKENNMPTAKRDEFLNKLLTDGGLKLVAIAGTHGKSTVTAMAIWLCQQLKLPVSYLVGAKISFGDIAVLDKASQYFIYECDEFDRNFLAFHPFYSLISGVGYDHHEIYPTEQDYYKAFNDFLDQSQRAILWQADAARLKLDTQNDKYTIEDENDPGLANINLAGLYNRRDAWLVVKAISQITGARPDDLYQKINDFPGLSRRFEKIVDNLYSDYAHTPEKILGVMSVARESARPDQKIVIVYEPLTNRRMHYTRDQHHSVFEGADQIYWVPSYLAREDPNQAVLTPAELIKSLSPDLQAKAVPMQLDEQLRDKISQHLKNGDMVVCLSGGGSGSLDEWLRQEFSET